MFKTLTAKFAGTCKRCGLAFEAGTKIRYGGRGRTYHLAADCPSATATAADSDSDDPQDETEARARYVNPRAVSNHIQIGGQDFYRNKRGRCEDAPCCGCCTI